MAKRVCIDAGHYGKYNRCPGNPNYYESDMVWKLHLLQKKYLEQLGIEVVTTRVNQATDLALASRGAASKGCDLFISDHSNAVGSTMNETVDYVAVYHLSDDTTTKCDDISKEIAGKLALVIAQVMGVKQGYKVLTRNASYDRNNDGIMNDNYYGVLDGARKAGTPGLILEHSFHTNSAVVDWLLKDENLDKLARAEVECIASYLLGKTVSLEQKKDPEDTNKLYRVQVGAYSKKENAENMFTKVKAAGFDTYMVKADGFYKIQVGAYSKKENAENMLAKVKVAGFAAFITTEVGQAVATTAQQENIYYLKYTGKSTSLDAILEAIGVPAEYRGNYKKRKPLAEANGISNYKGSEDENIKLKSLAIAGRLKKV